MFSSLLHKTALAEAYTTYLISSDLCFLCICDRAYPRKLAFTYLSDLSQASTTIYQPQQ